MNKRTIFCFVLVLLQVSAASQKTIKILDVNELGFSKTIEYKPQAKATFQSNGLVITVTPISPQDLDPMFQRSLSLDGRHKYSYYDKSRQLFFLKKGKKISEKDDADFLMEGLEWMVDEDIIDDSLSLPLQELILRKYEKGNEKNGSVNILSSASNPYALRDKYLSLFKLEYENQTSKPIQLSADFTVTLDDVSLKPLTQNQVERMLSNNQVLNNAKLENLERYHNPEMLTVPAGKKVIKYFSTLPLDNEIKTLEISLKGNEDPIRWNVITQKNSINKNFKFYEVLILPQIGSAFYFFGNSFIIPLNAVDDVFIEGTKMYVNGESLNKTVRLFVYALSRDKLYYSKIISVSPKEFLDLEKRKRKTLKVEMTQIKELDKKIQS